MFNTDLTQLETEKLIECVKKCGPEPMYIEIGVFEGGTLKKVLEQTNAQCCGIDLFEDFVVNKDNTHVTGTISKQSLQEALEQHFPNNRFSLVKDDSVKFLDIFSRMGEPLNGLVVFVDGNHKYEACMNDCKISLMCIKTGYLILHNASNTWEPDTWYINDDGGPYAVTQHLITNANKLGLTYEGTFDRSSIFKVG